MLLWTVHCIWDENGSSACSGWTELKVKQWPPHCTGKHWIGVVVVGQRNTTGHKYNLRSPKPDKLKQSSIYLIHSGHGWVSQTLILEILFWASILLQIWTSQHERGKLMDTAHLFPPQFPLLLIPKEKHSFPPVFLSLKVCTYSSSAKKFFQIQIPVHIKVEVILFSIPCFKVWVVLRNSTERSCFFSTFTFEFSSLLWKAR